MSCRSGQGLCIRRKLVVTCILFLSYTGGGFSQNSLSLKLDRVVSGLLAPVHVTHAGDRSSRLFIVEQAGRILICRDGTLQQTPFLDIQSRVASGGELGLLSVAFHPDYKNNRRFFVDYTTRQPSLQTVIAEYQANQNNPNLADATEKIILQINQPFSNHNGGQLQFGPDGYLYVGMGDGGSGGDPQGNGQNLRALLGKMLRIDVDHGTPYRIPEDNPYVAGGGSPEIWASGLRNPWRFSFDRLNGRLFAGDVGQNLYEEVDLIEAGGNYGWNRMEGNHCYSPSTGCDTTGLIFPIDEYSHSLGVSITGGYVYRGRQYPLLTGTYLFGDFGSSRIWGLKETNHGTWTRTELLKPGFPISSFGEDEEGELYVLDYGGSLYRIGTAIGLPAGGLQILIPSTVRTDRFQSSLSVINRDPTSSEIQVVHRDSNGAVKNALTLNLAPGELFRSADILADMGMSLQDFGSLTLESSSGKQFIAISEVRSLNGTAGYFPGVWSQLASNHQIISEAIDSGERGVAGTYRTNLGVNNPNPKNSNVKVSLVGEDGSQMASLNLTVPPYGMSQVNGIVSFLMGKPPGAGNTGFLQLVSDQPIQAWASKIDNGTDDPSLQLGIGEDISSTGIQLLIPSVSSTERFRSLVSVVNLEELPNRILVTVRNSGGEVLGTLSQTIPSNGRFRSLDILNEMAVPVGSFGALTIESLDRRSIAAVSEVRSGQGTGGFLPAVNTVSAALTAVLAEVADTGERGTAGTFRTNLGINNLGKLTARVGLELLDKTGNIAGTADTTIPPQGLKQINTIVNSILGRTSEAYYYLRITSDQPIIAWGSKIDNGTEDPSLIVGVPSLDPR